MISQVNIHISAQDEEQIAKPLVDFFAPIANVRIKKTTATAETQRPLRLTLTAAAYPSSGDSGASSLGPLTGNTANWWESVQLFWRQAGGPRPLAIVVNFAAPAGRFQATIDATDNPNALKYAWHYAQRAAGIQQELAGREIHLDKLRLLPDETPPLTLGYQGSRPQFIVNLQSKELTPIEAAPVESPQPVVAPSPEIAPAAVTMPAGYEPARRQRRWSNALRLLQYLAARTVALAITAVIAVWVAVFAANLGGYVDDIRRSQIRTGISLSYRPDPDMTREERTAALNAMIAAAEEAAGLNEPFLLRTTYAAWDGLRLEMGRSRIRTIAVYPPGGDRRDMKAVILERIPPTLLLLGTANLLIFLSSLLLALFLSRRYGSWLDRLMVSLSPTSVAPAWFYGLFLIAIFAGALGWLPYGGMRPEIPPDNLLGQILATARHMALPSLAIFVAVFFQSVYTWRTFFLVYAGEDYVELAKAKGLPAGLLARRYMLRPTLPPIITSFAFMLIGIWSGSIILEVIFNWPGLGELFFRAISVFETGMVVSLLVIYAYFLVATIFVLDLSYMLVDPRVRMGAQERNRGQGVVRKGRKGLWNWLRRLRQPRPTLPAPIPKRRFSLRQSLKGFVELLPALVRSGRHLRGVGREIIRYPSAIVGLLLIGLLLSMVVAAVTVVPYDEAIRHWRAAGDRRHIPANARPLWVNFVSLTKQPESMTFSTLQGDGDKEIQPLGQNREATITIPFDYPYDGFPREVVVSFTTPESERRPHVSMNWLTPDGREIRLSEVSPRNNTTYRPEQDQRLERRLGRIDPLVGLFADPDQAEPTAVRGAYELQVNAVLFEAHDDLDVTLMLHGQVYGLAGTDHMRRDIMVALLWGAPVALAFGLLAALLTTIGTMFISAISVWYGGMVDELIQRATDVNLVIPVFPILATITLFYTLSIWYILALAVLLGVLSSHIKTYRAIFLQVKESPYIEAAQAYGAGNWRIIFYYLIPRIVPVLIPQLVFLVPSYVFLEAGLAFLGLSDPILPTWGKVINDAHTNSALLTGHYYWILQPAFLLFMTGFAFALLGFALDRIFNPRLQESK